MAGVTGLNAQGTAGRARIVVVSGAPGAGKSSVAVPLAKALGFSLIAKDDIKEALFDALEGPAGDPDWSHRLSVAAMEVLWAVAQRSPRAVLDANFRPHSDKQRSRLAGLDADIVELHCRCPAQEAARRFAARAGADGMHPAHVLRELTPAMLSEYDGPIGIGRLIEVDTTRPVAVDRLAGEVVAALTHGPSAASRRR